MRLSELRMLIACFGGDLTIERFTRVAMCAVLGKGASK